MVSIVVFQFAIYIIMFIVRLASYTDVFRIGGGQSKDEFKKIPGDLLLLAIGTFLAGAANPQSVFYKQLMGDFQLAIILLTILVVMYLVIQVVYRKYADNSSVSFFVSIGEKRWYSFSLVISLLTIVAIGTMADTYSE